MSSTAFSYNVFLGYLRAFITLLVVEHHAVLAYHPFAPAPPTSLVAQPRIWQAFPVVDSQRSVILSLFTGFNDIFFMALMFFISGLSFGANLDRDTAPRRNPAHLCGEILGSEEDCAH